MNIHFLALTPAHYTDNFRPAGNVNLRTDRFQIGRAPATLRLYVGNFFDKFGWRTNSSEVFVVNGSRRFSLQIAADFPGAR